MKCQSLFSGKSKKNIINLSTAEFTKKSGKDYQIAPDQVFFLLFFSSGKC